MAETSHREDLDWDNLADPVPMNLIDSDFAEAPQAAEPEAPELPGARSAILPRETPESLMSQAPEPRPDATIEMPAMRPRDNDTDVFSGMRAQVEAQAAAEDEAKLKAEEEEAAQRLRLEQWMANARARLQVADEEPQVPGAPIRVRREPSPTMIRLAEMQKTMFEPGEAETLADFENGSGYKTGKISLDGSDPMATIIVPKDTFVESPDPRTGKLKSLERKVAQIKQMEAGAETMIMAAPAAEPEKANVRIAVWVLGGLIPVILGLGLFALMRTGYLEGLGDLFPTLAGRPAHEAPKPVPPEPEAAVPSMPTAPSPLPAAAAPTAVPVTAAPVAAPAPSRIPAPPAALSKTVPPPAPNRIPVAKAKSPVPAAPKPTSNPAAKPVAKAVAKPKPAPAVAAPAAPAAPTAMDAAASALANARRSAEASMAGVQVAQPFPRNESATSARGEEVLKASVQAVLHKDAEDVQSIYEKFAMGTPGLNGDIVIGITVEPKGHILEGSVASSSTGAPAFDQELLRLVLEWKLSPFPDNRPRYVAVPFHFEPKDEPKAEAKEP